MTNCNTFDVFWLIVVRPTVVYPIVVELIVVGPCVLLIDVRRTVVYPIVVEEIVPRSSVVHAVVLLPFKGYSPDDVA